MPLPDPTRLREAARAERVGNAAAAAKEMAHQRAVAAAEKPALRARLDAEAHDGIERDKTAGRLTFHFGEAAYVFSKKDPAYLAKVEVREEVVRAFVAEARKRGGYRVSARKVDFESDAMADAMGSPPERGTAWDITIRWKT